MLVSSMATSSELRGVNLAGGEFSWGSVPSPKEGQNWQFVSDVDIDYLAAKGVKFARLLFCWELLQPTLSGPLNTVVGSYGERFVSRIAKLRAKGIHVMVEPHGAESPKFARYNGNLVGSAAVPNAAFADLWSRLATLYKGDPDGVSFGLTNEPNSMSTAQWFAAAGAAVSAIRATGASNRIMCPGNGWSGASSWTSNWYDTAATKLSNATAWKQFINDPLNRTLVSVHCYFDADRGGATNDVVDPLVGVNDLKVTVDWAKANGLKVHVGEFAASAANPVAATAVKNFLDYIDANRDVIEGWAWWAYGPPSWWGGYRFTLCPSSNYTVDAPVMAWLKDRFTPPAPTTPSVPTSATFPTAPVAFTKGNVLNFSTSKAPYWAYVPNSYDSTHATPTKLFVWLHGCGGSSSSDIWKAIPRGTQNWIVVSPGGAEGKCWSVGTDAAIVMATIADIKTKFNIDPSRIFMGGYSSGGDLTMRTAFENSSVFAGVLVTNSAPFYGSGLSQQAALAAATKKFNVAFLCHTGDTTYPIAMVKQECDVLRANGFPTTFIEKPGSHWDNDNGAFGTQYDMITYLLPFIDAGWTNNNNVVVPPLPPPPPPPPPPAATKPIVAAAKPGVVSFADVSKTFSFAVSAYPGVVDGTYKVAARARCVYNVADGYSLSICLENPSPGVDITWSQLQVDVGDATVSSVWGCDFVGTARTGLVTLAAKPDTCKLVALGRNGFGCYVKRGATAATALVFKKLILAP